MIWYVIIGSMLIGVNVFTGCRAMSLDDRAYAMFSFFCAAFVALSVVKLMVEDILVEVKKSINRIRKGE